MEPPVLSPDAQILPETAAQDPGNSAGHGRQRAPMGTIPWIPGIFGLTLAAEAVQIITG